MTSNLKRLPSSSVAVVVAIAIVFFLIALSSVGFVVLLSRIAFGHRTASSSKSTSTSTSPSLQSISPSESSWSSLLSPSQQQPFASLVKNDNWSIRNDDRDEEDDDDSFPSKFEKSRHVNSNLKERVNDGRRQLIRPIKVTPLWSPPFEENLLVEKNGSSVGGVNENRVGFFHHHSGNFRGNKAPVWDPHPEYEFHAFGQLFHLVLEQDSEFAHPSLKVTVVSKNFTVQREPDVNPSGCYYSGVLQNQSNSNVVVSLCNGMTGHIKSENGTYFVEPAEPFDENLDTFLHSLYRLDLDADADADVEPDSDSDAQDSKHSANPSDYSETPTQCELLENATDATAPAAIVATKTTMAQQSTSYGGGENDHDDADDENEDDDDADDEDEEDGGSDVDDNYTKMTLGARTKRSMAVESVENIVELMIAADDKMSQYHGSELHNYVLTLMSMVNKIYKDKSIGNPMHITVVKLVVLSDRDIVSTQLSNEDTALPETLDNFCRWQQSNKNDRNANHHDCALLLSREITCKLRNTDKCYDKLGLAQLGTMCKRNCCAIIRDNGLSTAFTIAHELGHVFNMPHDEDEKCSRFNEKGIKKRVMSKQLGKDTHPWKWSACSRHFLTEFLDAGNDVCLHNDPFSRDIFNSMDADKDAQQLPGEKYSKDVQCEMIYGKGYRSCSYVVRQNNCSSLWCTDSEKMSGCHSNGMPPAEGTSCGPSHWCQQGECVHVDRKALKPLDGGWGPWQPFGECSRSCGGGIKRAYRLCDSPSPKNGGKFCLGKRVKYQSCNFKECPIGTADFRSQQCASYNNNSFGIRNLGNNVRWVPHYYGFRENGNEKCKLYCRAENTSPHYKLQDKVIDGTTCGPNTYDMCVNGVCMKAGCDHILNSNSVLDSCGVCGGDNSTCKKVRKRFGTADGEFLFGYNRVTVIPAGASNINIQQRSVNGSKDENYLALVDIESGQYVLNGNFSIVRKGKEIDYDGVAIAYSGSEVPVERINTSQPLRKDLLLQVLCADKVIPPDIVCEYNVPISPQDYFVWRVTDKWSACDKVCDGEQVKIIRCTRKDTANYVSEESCSGLPKPKAQIKVCNQHCTLRWNVVSQTECSSLCGLGFRSVTLGCFQEFTENIFPRVQLPDVSCRHIVKPAENQSCFGACDTYRWKYDEWHPCSVSCGNGVQTREASCVDEFQRVVDDAKCATSEKIVQKLCVLQTCSLWTIGEWSECSVSCGLGRKVRQVRCQQANRLVHAHLCAGDRKPPHIEPCEMPACQPTAIIRSSASGSGSGSGNVNANASPTEVATWTAAWIAGMWSECSASCGIGYKTRTVRCNAFDQSSCSPSTKPAARQICDTTADCWTSSTPKSTAASRTNEIAAAAADDPTDDRTRSHRFASFKWITDDWQPCSSSCGQGEQKRAVRCYSVARKLVVDRSSCDASDMPAESQSCSQVACSIATAAAAAAEWKTTEWSWCSSSCGLGVSARNVWCEMNGIQVDERQCNGTRPPETVACDNRDACATTAKSSPTTPTPTPTPTPTLSSSSTPRHRVWRTGKWGQCSRSCGAGLKIRHVVCHDENGNEAPDCDSGSKPPAFTSCNTDPCDDSSVVAPTSTSPSPSPSPSPIEYRWIISDWTSCSVTCGVGFQTRSIQCARVTPANANANATATSASSLSEHGGGRDEGHHVVSNEFCDDSGRRPPPPPVAVALQRECRSNQCSGDYIWVPETWSECDASCGDGGTGKQKRKLACFHRSGRKVKKSFCKSKRKPARKRKCTSNKCEPASCAQVKRRFKSYADREYSLNIFGRNISIYCHRMWSDSPAEYLTLTSNADTENYSEFFATASSSGNDNGNGNATGTPQSSGNLNGCFESFGNAAQASAFSTKAGKTSFQKIRLDITSLEVNTSDWTFSRQIFGSPVPYGEAAAAHCYSALNCARGSFAINLKGTGLRVSPSISWLKTGVDATMKIDFSNENRKVVAKCVGYCASCRPIRTLKLDILPP